MNRPLNEDLRQLFERKVAAMPQGARQRVVAGVSQVPRRPATNWQWAAGFVALVLAVAVAGTFVVARENQRRSVPQNRPPAGVIPWLPLPPQLEAPVVESQTPTPPPAGIKRCTSTQLQMDVLGSNGAGGHVFRSFGFSGRGTTACFLQGTPTVALHDSSGRLLPFKARRLFSGSVSSGPVLVEPGPLPDPNTALKSGQAALTIDWVSQPEACSGSEGVQIAMARITLPAGGAPLSVALAGNPAAYVCAGLGIDAFEGPPPAVQEPPTLPLPAVVLKNVPSKVRAGDVLIYEVTLSNDGQLPMDLLANCPSYGEELLPNSSTGNSPPRAIKPSYQLNCAPAGTIWPGASLTFEMRVQVPRDAAPGSYRLFFTIGYWNEMTTPASAPVTISG